MKPSKTRFFLPALLAIAAFSLLSCSLLAPAGIGAGEGQSNRVIILATTTSTYDSGLLDALIPVFEDQSGYAVKIIAVGTGKALKMGEEGNADLLLVHAPAAEQAFMAAGHGVDRRLIMHNDFLFAGPADDLAKIQEAASPSDALARIHASQALFISRGDDSGTHKKELSLWGQAGLSPGGDRYLETGQGMGATLRVASEKGAYTLTDRSTYLSLQDTLALEILYEGSASLLNIYHTITINPARWPIVNEAGATALSVFLTSEQGQALIAGFGVETFGEPLFFPDAGKTESEMEAE